LQLLSVLVKVEVDSAIVSCRLVDENVVEIVANPLHGDNAKRRNIVVYDVLPSNLTLNHICSDDINNVVPDVEQLDEVVELLLDEVLNLLVQPVGNVLGEIETYELAR
jgi:hypothetical protein